MLKKNRIAIVVAGALFAAQTGLVMGQSEDGIGMDDPASSTQQLTVYNPDGSSYSMAALDLATGMLEPAIVAMDESLPDQLTVFEPGGLSYSYELAPLEVALIDPVDAWAAEGDVLIVPLVVSDGEFPVFMTEPVVIVAMDQDASVAPLAVIDEDADLRPTYVAHFVSPPSYTGVLEEALS